MALFNMDKTKQREVRNAVIVGVAASASTTIWDAVQRKVPALSGENTELFKALGGAVLLGVAPRRNGLAKDLVENIGLGMIVSGTLNFAAQPVSNLLASVPGLSGYAPRRLEATALAGYAPRAMLGGSLAPDTAPVI